MIVAVSETSLSNDSISSLISCRDAILRVLENYPFPVVIAITDSLAAIICIETNLADSVTVAVRHIVRCSINAVNTGSQKKIRFLYS
jgi:hypothetical protein